MKGLKLQWLLVLACLSSLQSCNTRTSNTTSQESAATQNALKQAAEAPAEEVLCTNQACHDNNSNTVPHYCTYYIYNNDTKGREIKTVVTLDEPFLLQFNEENSGPTSNKQVLVPDPVTNKTGVNYRAYYTIEKSPSGKTEQSHSLPANVALPYDTIFVEIYDPAAGANRPATPKITVIRQCAK